MAFPNDSSRIARGLANLETATNDYTSTTPAGPSKASRSLIRKTYVLVKSAVDGTAGATTTYTAGYLIRMKNPYRLLGAYILPIGAATADATNNAVVSVVSADGAGGAQIAMSTYTSNVAGGNLAAGVTKTLTNSATAANLMGAAGTLLGFSVTKGGTGVAVPALTISVDVEEEGPDGYAV